MTKKSWKEQGVPYNEARMEYLSYPDWGSSLIPADNFWAVLEVEGYGRGRSAVTIELKSPEGITFPMFISDFVELVKTRIHDYEMPGCYSLDWEFVKRGSNYGIRAVRD